MGGGGSKKKKQNAEQSEQRPVPMREKTPSQSSPPPPPDNLSRRSSANDRQSPMHIPASPVDSRPTSVRTPELVVHNQAAGKRRPSNMSNGSNPGTPRHDYDNISRRDRDDALSPQDSPKAPQSPLHQSSTSSVSSSKHHKHLKHSSASSNGHVGHCSHCPHCQRVSGKSLSSGPKPKWITKNGPNEGHIRMDEYDAEAVKDKVISENGHVPGCFDYRPNLTIEQIDDNDEMQENYYTQPVLAKTKPRFTPARTPFPDYALLQRREQRLNKPYTLSLFQ